MSEMKVKEFAVPLKEYPHLKESQTLKEAIKALRSFTSGEDDVLHFRNLLVLNEQREIVGRAGLRDVLAGLEPRLLGMEGEGKFEGREAEYPNLTILWGDSFLERCHDQADKPIKDFMSPIKRTVRAEDPILKALYIMLRSGEEAIPVLEDGKVYGVIRIGEVFKAVCEKCRL